MLLKVVTQILATTMGLFCIVGHNLDACADEPSSQVAHWLQPQVWQRDNDGPVLSLGKKGEFDDTHMFAPMVAVENGEHMLWYCGSQGDVANRVFQMGLATSQGGAHFAKQSMNPVFSFEDKAHSVLTPTLLKNVDGTPIREKGKLRMWFSSTAFKAGGKVHTLHEATSVDGKKWSAPSQPQLEDIYAPTVITESGKYRMWYTDVKNEPWIFRYAESDDGKQWHVAPDPILTMTQKWEKGRLFYPTVIKVDDIYLMWYGSYWSARPQTTALGFAASSDGIHWHKHPQNPVLRPDPSRNWESHYVTSQSVIRYADGRFRIWYASRKSPPFINKYFAINTATWLGPKAE